MTIFQQTRKIPAILMQQVAKTDVTAKTENVKEGYCPICNTVMKPSTANGVRVITCLTHSIVMPVRD
jgi:RNase P subunit RPR2